MSEPSASGFMNCFWHSLLEDILSKSHGAYYVDKYNFSGVKQ